MPKAKRERGSTPPTPPASGTSGKKAKKQHKQDQSPRLRFDLLVNEPVEETFRTGRPRKMRDFYRADRGPRWQEIRNDGTLTHRGSPGVRLHWFALVSLCSAQRGWDRLA